MHTLEYVRYSRSRFIEGRLVKLVGELQRWLQNVVENHKKNLSRDVEHASLCTHSKEGKRELSSFILNSNISIR